MLIKPFQWLAGPTLLFYALPWLMAQLVLGTVAQRYIGLYRSERLFFGSFLFWLGPLPLPGAYTTLGAIALSLTAKLALRTRLNRRSIGIILIHASALLLLVGGLVSALFREEGYIVLGEGESGSVVSDYYARELAVLKDGKTLFTLPPEAGHSVTANGLTVTALCYERVADLTPISAPGEEYREAAATLAISPAPAQAEETPNRSASLVRIDGAGKDADGVYLAAQALVPPEFSRGGTRYKLVLRPRARTLPFSLTLRHFVKDDYPGTDMAQSYRSDVTVNENGTSWDETISMNQPLRRAGYVLYQSSYADENGRKLTVLAVVKNAGRLFPYIAVSLLCLGLAVHLALRSGKKAAA